MGWRSAMGLRKYVLDERPDPPCARVILIGEGAAHCKCRDFSAVSCAKMAEPIEMLFGLGVWTQIVSEEACIRWCARWRHLTNTTEPSICGGDAASLSNYLTTCFFKHFIPFFLSLPSSPSFHRPSILGPSLPPSLPHPLSPLSLAP